MSLDIYIDDQDAFFATDEPGVMAATYAGRSFGVKWFREDATQDNLGVVNSQAYFLAKATDVLGISYKQQVLVGSDEALGDGFADDGDMFIDLGDAFDMLGITVYYVIEVRDWGDVGLTKQIFLSKDKPS